MNEHLSYILAIALVFGGLAIWPLMRKLLGINDGRVKWLKGIFFAHIILMLLSFGMVHYCYYTSLDWLHCLILPYLVGLLSYVASICISVIIR